MSAEKSTPETRVREYIELAENVGVDYYDIVSMGERTELDIADLRAVLADLNAARELVEKINETAERRAEERDAARATIEQIQAAYDAPMSWPGFAEDVRRILEGRTDDGPLKRKRAAVERSRNRMGEA